MADHERVVVSELAVQGLDQGWDLRAGLADGEVGQPPGVTFPGSEGLKASRIARPLTPVTSVSTEVSFMLVSSSSFSSR
jgi:hypothetical protein